MPLKTKLVLSAMGVTFAMVLVLSLIFLGELLRQRIAQTASDNEVLAHEVLLMTRQAVEIGLRENPPADRSAAAFQAAVTDALQSYNALSDTMNAIVRYTPTVQDVSVANAGGEVLVSTDPDAMSEPVPGRISLGSMRDGSLWYQAKQMFGKPNVFDIALPLDRNGTPFLVVHVGVRSSFLRAAYLPWLHAGLWFTVLAAIISVLAAAGLANVALRPIKEISEKLERLTLPEQVIGPEPKAAREGDAVVKVSRTIDRLGRQIRTTEAEYTALQANLNYVLDSLRDGVLLFTADRRAAMVSDAAAHFIHRDGETLVGKDLEEIFTPETPLGAAVFRAVLSESPVPVETIGMEDGRRIQISIDRIEDAADGGAVGTLITLRDMESAARLEQELEVSRRLVAIGKLTAGVGHEVKNPINAMVLHLELLRSKLNGGGQDAVGAAQRHVDILAGEMQRLDRVVQTLADFTRPMELHLEERDLRRVARAVVDLTGAEMASSGVQVELSAPPYPLMVRVDEDQLRQAMLNLLLNAMQAMPEGGVVRLVLRREQYQAIVEVIDTGEGIPPEVLPRIFDLYFTTKPTGSGIGLAMTYRILQMHGGAMEVRSSTGSHSDSMAKGTTFTLRLPVITRSTEIETRETSRAGSLPMELERRV